MRVIAVLVPANFRVIVQPFDGIIFQFPTDAIFTEAAVQVHVALFVVSAENTCKTVPEG